MDIELVFDGKFCGSLKLWLPVYFLLCDSEGG